MIKLQFYHSNLGTLTVKPDAEGTEDFEETIKRSEKTDGVVYDYALDLQFNKEAKAYLTAAFYNFGGIEALVVVNVFEYRLNAFGWVQIGTGTVKFTNQERSEPSFKTSIEQIGFQTKVLNLMDTDVDVETLVSQGGATLPATPSFTIQMHPKKIVKQTIVGPTDGLEFQKEGAGHITVPNGSGSLYREILIYGQVDNGKTVFNEYKVFQQPYGYDSTLADGLQTYTPAVENQPGTIAAYKLYLQNVQTPRFEIKRIENDEDAGVGTLTLRWNLKHEIIVINGGGDVDIQGCGSGALARTEITYWFEHRDADNNIKGDIEHMGTYDLPGCGDSPRTGTFQSISFTKNNIDLKLGDKVYVYFLIRIYGNHEQPGGLVNGNLDYTVRITSDVTEEAGTFIDFKVDTVFPETTAKVYGVFEALKKMFQHYSDQNDCFRSAYFGRTDTVPAYDVDGPGSLRAITSGANIRKLPDRTTTVNGNDFFGALNAIDCLGLGFEKTEVGRPVVVIEPLSYFYNKDLLILDLGPVSDLKISVDTKSYGNQIELAYGKIDIQKTNGIDDPNGLRRWKFPITQISTKILATTKYKVSPYEIEDQRRKSANTEDSKNDDINFLLSLIRSGMTFLPKKTEGYMLIQNVYDSASMYNLDLSPRRNLDNWLQVVAMSLYLSTDKTITFSTGEGNYLMVTQKTGEANPKPEGGPGVKVDLTGVKPLYLPERQKFNCPLSSAQMTRIRQVPYGYFIFQEYRGGVNHEGFLSKVTRSDKKKLGTFELLKVSR
jgi:hypothetical protein